MQNKGLIKLFAVLFGLVSLYQLSFTFKNSAIESEALAIAESKIDASVEDRNEKVNDFEVNYLDSLAASNEKVFLGSTYAEVKENSMNTKSTKITFVITIASRSFLRYMK